MSEFKVIEIQLSEQSALVDALIEMGYKPRIHADAQQLHGYQGDLRKQRAHIVIPRSQVGSASNDIGFEKKGDTYIMHVSEYDKRIKSFNIKKLNQLYAKHRITKAVKMKSKYSLSSQKIEKDGRIRIRIRVSA